jgi:hypothetical protein
VLRGFANQSEPIPSPPVSRRADGHERLQFCDLVVGVQLRDAQILARHADPRTTEHALVTSRGSVLVVERKAFDGDRANSRRCWRVPVEPAQLRTTWNVGLDRVTHSAAARRSRQIA